MEYKEDEDKFRELLNQEYSWPTKYTFKFIVPASEEKAIEDIFKIMENTRSAGIIIIGDEVLSGRVNDLNSPYLLNELHSLGVTVKMQFMYWVCHVKQNLKPAPGSVPSNCCCRGSKL